MPVAITLSRPYPVSTFSAKKHDARIHHSCLEGKAAGGKRITTTGITGPKDEMDELAKKMNKTSGRRGIQYFWTEPDDNIDASDYAAGNKNAKKALDDAHRDGRANNIQWFLMFIATLGTIGLLLFNAFKNQ